MTPNSAADEGKIMQVGFTRGIAWALCYLSVFHGEDTIAEMMLFESQLTWNNFKNAGVDDADLVSLRKLWNENKRKEVVL